MPARVIFDGDNSLPSWSPDGTSILFQPRMDGEAHGYMVRRDGDDQVYVQRFPELGPRMKISTEGGREPRWSRDGSELFLRDYASGNVLSVEVLPGDEVFEPGAFRELFSHEAFARAASATVWEVHPDGERFVFVRGDSDGGTGAFSLSHRVVITNAVGRER